MNPALTELRKELASKGYRRGTYSVGKTPIGEGHCILQEGNIYLVFYYERGNRYELHSHVDVNDAIYQFRERLQNDLFTK
ncbi:hypothetical protein [Shewanella zhangzhouensis]|uniref:hypothetical protein n=1 Tax=Shewanella zhangzhouensis TaxID=2864213 RepID=UPI001C660456|nr:hypothetical protein [Shewanella zhangzhouensis]QYK06882.1 hypothetical protein K0H63_08830 [Shewanella zhangzhouensis]